MDMTPLLENINAGEISLGGTPDGSDVGALLEMQMEYGIWMAEVQATSGIISSVTNASQHVARSMGS